jgi:cell division inhibitor SepF
MNLLQRLRDALGLSEEFEDYDEYDEDDGSESASYGDDAVSRRKSNNVIGMPGLTMEIVLIQPSSFEEIPQAVTALRERKSVILNLNLMEPEQAQRCADYVAGGAFAIDGHQRQLGPTIFLFTPNFVQISQQPAVDPAVMQQLASLHSNAGHAAQPREQY